MSPKKLVEVLAEARPQEEILSELVQIREEIAVHDEALSGLYARRIDVWLEGRGMDPPIVQASLGEASGVKEPAVINALRKAREREAEA